MLFSRPRLISLKNFTCFRRGGETGGHAWRRSSNFHGSNVEQQRTGSSGPFDYTGRKTAPPGSHPLRYVTIVNCRYSRKVVAAAERTTTASGESLSTVQNAQTPCV